MLSRMARHKRRKVCGVGTRLKYHLVFEGHCGTVDIDTSRQKKFVGRTYQVSASVEQENYVMANQLRETCCIPLFPATKIAVSITLFTESHKLGLIE
jgi:dTDP-D-glucose 4,6-dehydratase